MDSVVVVRGVPYPIQWRLSKPNSQSDDSKVSSQHRDLNPWGMIYNNQYQVFLPWNIHVNSVKLNPIENNWALQLDRSREKHVHDGDNLTRNEWTSTSIYILANTKLRQYLSRFGYTKVKHKHGNFRQKTGKWSSIFVVDDFGVNYSTHSQLNYLKNNIETKYKTTSDITGSL